MVDFNLMVKVLFVDLWCVEINIGLQLETIDIGDIIEGHSFLIEPESTLGELTKGLEAFPFKLTDFLPVTALGLLTHINKKHTLTSFLLSSKGMAWGFL